MMKAEVTDNQEAGFEGLGVDDFTGMGGSCWIWLECIINV